MKKKYFIRLLLLGFFLWLAGSYVGSLIATRTHFKKLPAASVYFTQPVENQTFTAEDGIEISSWWIPHKNSGKAIILLNGIGGSRVPMASRAHFYQQKNYNILMPDLRGTGESKGEAITFGWQERWDLLAAVNFLNKKGIDTVAVHGISLGAATAVYSFQHQPDYYFVVLESCYDNITNALKNRIEKYHLPLFLFAAMTKFTEWRVGADSVKLRPEDYMKFCKYPTLFLAGDSEQRVKKEETEKLFQKCISPKKTFTFFSKMPNTKIL